MMRELTQQEIDQVSAGPSAPAPVSAISTILDAAIGSFSSAIPLGTGMPFVVPSLAAGKPA
jgi:hypothetical protein